MVSDNENTTVEEKHMQNKKQIDDFVIVEDEDKVNRNRFFNCCGKMRQKNNDIEISNDVKNLKNLKNKEKIQTCKSNNQDNNENNNENNNTEDSDLNKDNEKDEVLKKAEEGCADCGSGCTKVCNCFGFFIARWFNSLTDCCKSCFGCSDKKNN